MALTLAPVAVCQGLSNRKPIYPLKKAHGKARIGRVPTVGLKKKENALFYQDFRKLRAIDLN
jgi:hypothetical protein